nr:MULTISPECIES: DDE-type integrase/transposase/recombinase [unclassified Streptomyces]
MIFGLLTLEEVSVGDASPSCRGHRYPVEAISHCVWLYFRIQNRRDTAAARRFFRRLLKTTRAVPRVLVTDKPRSYSAAHREVMPSVEHRCHKGLNNRAENSHQPTRQRERAMKGFRSTGGAQRFLAAFSGISPHFRPRRHLMTAADH